MSRVPEAGGHSHLTCVSQGNENSSLYHRQNECLVQVCVCKCCKGL